MTRYCVIAGLLDRLAPGSTVVVLSTVSPAYCQALAQEADKRGVRVIDCPVSGRVEGAESGTLTLMAGGDDEVIDECSELLSPLGPVVRCGEVGSGQLTKVANNTLFIGMFALSQEVRDVVEASGMNVRNFSEILNQSTGRSWVSENVAIPRERRPLSAMPLKELGVCRDLAESFDIEVPVVEQVLKHGTKVHR